MHISLGKIMVAVTMIAVFSVTQFHRVCFCLFTAGASFTNFIRVPCLSACPISAEEEQADRYIYFGFYFTYRLD